MSIVAAGLVALVALIHAYILVLEMFLWRTDRGRKAFGTTPEQAETMATLAANQGLYNGFLAAGLVISLFLPQPTAPRIPGLPARLRHRCRDLWRADRVASDPRRPGPAGGPGARRRHRGRLNVADMLTTMRARDPHEAHRPATPLELLFDLTFVVAIAALVPAARSRHRRRPPVRGSPRLRPDLLRDLVGVDELHLVRVRLRLRRRPLPRPDDGPDGRRARPRGRHPGGVRERATTRSGSWATSSCASPSSASGCVPPGRCRSTGRRPSATRWVSPPSRSSGSSGSPCPPRSRCGPSSSSGPPSSSSRCGPSAST